MKKTLFIFALLVPVLYCHGQNPNIVNAKKRIIRTWIAQGDSLAELDITADSIVTFKFRANGVSRCSYKIVDVPCDKNTRKSPTGMYLAEEYKNKTICCALSEVTDISLKIIYPDGTEIKYKQQELTSPAGE